MNTLLTPDSLKTFFDANPARYKVPYAGTAPLADGYLPSPVLNELLVEQRGTIPNPNPPVQVPAPFTAEQILAAISSADALKVVGAPLVGKLIDAINAQDRAACLAWASLFQIAGFITAAEETAVATILNATMPDPNWSPTIPWPSDLAALTEDDQ